MNTQDEKELYRRIDEVPPYLRDPGGVSGEPSARDEYQSYVPQALALLNENADTDRIAGYLNEIATKRMGLRENADATLQVVDVLQRWKAALMAAWGGSCQLRLTAFGQKQAPLMLLHSFFVENAMQGT